MGMAIATWKFTKKIENLKDLETADSYSLLVISKTIKRNIEWLLSDLESRRTQMVKKKGAITSE